MFDLNFLLTLYPANSVGLFEVRPVRNSKLKFVELTNVYGIKVYSQPVWE